MRPITPDPHHLWARRLSALLCAAVAAVIVLAPGPMTPVAWAQQNVAKAKQAYKEARKAYKDGDFAKAADLFEQAYEFDPKPALLFNIGQAYKEAGLYVQSYDYYTRYLEEVPGAPNTEDVQATLFELQQLMAAQMAMITIDADDGFDVFVDDETEARCQTPCIVNLHPGSHTIAVTGEKIEREEQVIEPKPQDEFIVSFTPKMRAEFVGKLLVTTDIENAMLMVDGMPQGILPIEAPLVMPPGTYPVNIMVGKEVKWRGTAVLRAGDITTLDIPLKDQGQPVAEGGQGLGTMGVTAFALWGVGAAALGAGAFFGLSANAIESDLDNQVGAGQGANADLIDQGETQKLYANVFMITGVAAVTTGVILYLLDDGAAEESSAPQAAGEFNGDLVPLEGGALLRIQTPF